MPGYPWHQKQPLSNIITPSTFDLSTSLFSQPSFNHMSAYDSLDLGYDFGLASAENAIAASNVSPQQVFGYSSICPEEPQSRLSSLTSQDDPSIKREPESPESHHEDDSDDRDFPLATSEDRVGTDVDSLMKTIQTKVKNPLLESCSYQVDAQGPDSSSELSSSTFDYGPRLSAPRRNYACKIGSCAKVFTQKTHLEIHTRAHTGFKPYVRVFTPVLAPRGHTLISEWCVAL